jgi:choline dehydrogenase-like flavoprotein
MAAPNSIRGVGDIIVDRWDAVSIGTGMRGATLGHALAARGWRVLFLERGRDRRGADALVGAYPDAAGQGATDALLKRAGREILPIVDASQKRHRSFVPFVGSGTGGSSALYGMVLERFFPSDFATWPVGYEAMAPYYARAEALFRVHGTPDPRRLGDASLKPPAAPLSRAASDIAEHLAGRGLSTYRLPQANDQVDDCQSCQSYLCAKACKNDSAKVCLHPALDDHGATLLDQCEVTHIEANARAVTAVVCKYRGEIVRIPCERVVLAAGALHSPNLLLRSRSADWAHGLANRSGLVGRNLMRHYIDLYLVEVDREAAAQGAARKEIGCSDFYEVDGVKLGSLQSFGALPPAAMLMSELLEDTRQGPHPWFASALSLAKPLIGSVLTSMVESSVALATIVEDTAVADNRVEPNPHGSGVEMIYKLPPGDGERVTKMRALVGEALKGRKHRLIKQAENNQRIAHACGTCRAGDQAKTSVVDANNRAHDLTNLWIVDGSFFPTSAATNPALTIAANALRVADRMLTDC